MVYMKRRTAVLEATPLIGRHIAVPESAWSVCSCGRGSAFWVTVVDPLVMKVGPLPVCSGCMPAMNDAVALMCDESPQLVVSIVSAR